MLFSLLLSALACAGCGKIPAETTPAASDSLPVPPVSDDTTVLPEPVPPVIHSFYELNTVDRGEGTHAKLSAFSSLEADFRSRNELPQEKSGAKTPYYTRIKQLQDGSYILLYNDTKNMSDIRMMRSSDGETWEDYTTVFAHSGTKVYAGADAIVLPNGDILVCVSWRFRDSYYTNPYNGGISIRRSTDNGQTWGNEQLVFRGINWEPSFLLLRSGELHLYWTNTTCYVLPTCNNTSTGTAMLRSFDYGVTWTGDPKVTYSGQIVSQQATERIDGVQFYTDQMPVAVELQNGTILLALESRLDRNNTYRITLSYSKDNWATPMEKNEIGPRDKYTNRFVGTAPYVRQFPSGEVLLKYSRLTTMTLLLSDSTGRNFDESKKLALENLQGWGNIELLAGGHTAICSSTARYDVGKDSEYHLLATQKANLNHALFSGPAEKIVIDGNADDWADNTDALFVGSASQAQMSVRFARSTDRFCLLFERLDYDLTETDTCTVRIALPDSKSSYLNVTVSPDGSAEVYSLVNGTKTVLDAKCAVSLLGTLGDGSDTDTGYIAEVELSASVLPESISVYPMLVNKDTGGKRITDVLDTLSEDNRGWIPVSFS